MKIVLITLAVVAVVFWWLKCTRKVRGSSGNKGTAHRAMTANPWTGGGGVLPAHVGGHVDVGT